MSWFYEEGVNLRFSRNQAELVRLSRSQVSVIPTPGHTGQDVSVQVKGTSAGTVLVAGDLFERCSDDDTWRDLSLNAAAQEVSRQKALNVADVIIPGHGLPFRVVRSPWPQGWVGKDTSNGGTLGPAPKQTSVRLCEGIKFRVLIKLLVLSGLVWTFLSSRIYRSTAGQLPPITPLYFYSFFK